MTLKAARVMHLISSEGLYGAEQVTLNLCTELLAGSFLPIVASFLDRRKPYPELQGAAEEAGVPTRLIHCRRRIDFRAIMQIRRLLIQDAIGILHCHGFKADTYGLLAASLLGIPLVATVHGWMRTSRIIRIYEFLDSHCLRLFDRVVAVSWPMQQDLTKAGIASHRLAVIPSGISLARASCTEPSSVRSELGIGTGELAIGVIGRLSPEKGHHHLLQAARIVVQREPRVRFLLVGDGPLRSELQQEVAALGLQRSVILAGVRRDMPAIYGILDLVVSASLREGLPLALLEALAAGRAVIATRVGGIPDIVQDGVTGVLVEPGDEVGLARAILDLLADPSRSIALGHEGRRVVEARFSASRMAREYERVYAELLTESAARGAGVL